MYSISGFPFLARVRDSDAARDGAVAERARVGGARRADDEVVAGEEEDGARAIHAHDALVPVLRLVALALDPPEVNTRTRWSAEN